MSREEKLEERVENLEERQKQLTEVVQELVDIASPNLDNTPMSLFDAKTWKDPEMGEHIFIVVDEMVEQSPDRLVEKKKVRHRVEDVYGHTKAEVRATMKRLIDENVLHERDRRVRISGDAKHIDPETLFKSNLTHAEERREYAAQKGKSVDNPNDKYR